MHGISTIKLASRFRRRRMLMKSDQALDKELKENMLAVSEF
jgi:hypothetical protein